MTIARSNESINKAEDDGGWMPESGSPMRCSVSFRRRWPASAIFVAGSARRPCATEVQDHLICGNAPAGLIVVYQADPALATRRWSSKAISMRLGSLRGSILDAPGLGFCVSKTIIPEAQEHFLTLSARRDTHLFGGLGLRRDRPGPSVSIGGFGLNWYIILKSYTAS